MNERNERRATDGHMEDLKTKINDIDTKLEVLISKFESMHTSKNNIHGQIFTSISKHEHTLYGNGSPGITTKIEAIKDIKANLESHTRLDMGLFAMLFSAQIAILTKVMGVW